VTKLGMFIVSAVFARFAFQVVVPRLGKQTNVMRNPRRMLILDRGHLLILSDCAFHTFIGSIITTLTKLAMIGHRRATRRTNFLVFYSPFPHVHSSSTTFGAINVSL